MTLCPYVFDATADNFQRLVMENSTKGPVLVNYWSPRAGPCMVLMPRLVRLATEFKGRFLLVMLNTDELGQLARAQGVNSLPTVQVFHHGKVIDTLRSAESEASVRTFINRHVAARSDALHVSALAAHQGGDTARATSLAAEAALEDPDNPRIPLDIAKLLVLQGRYTQAHGLLTALPDDLGDRPEIRNLLTHIGFIQTAQTAPSMEDLEQASSTRPDDLEARYQLAARRLLDNDYDGAVQELLEIMRRDRGFRDDCGYHGIQAILQLLSQDREHALRVQKQLQDVLH